MTKLIYLVLPPFFTAVIAMPAQAAKATSTPPLPVTNPDGIACIVTNVGKKPIDVVWEVVGNNGTVVGGNGSPVTVAPGASTGGGQANASISGAVYCRVQGFSTKQVHVTACVQTSAAIVSGDDECLSVSTAP